ncbi:hypothetical protein [Nocardia sp. CY41]|uniref:hypothetical protein n=1 Tax=Nocardia sp. CY41 TaxID=2608686 RepID=UPI00135719D6|nr:hypothetical protein [Nocardia sp. CY41]
MRLDCDDQVRLRDRLARYVDDELREKWIDIWECVRGVRRAVGADVVVPTADIIAALQLLADHRDRVDTIEHDLLTAASASGATWDQLARALGRNSRQAMQQYAKRVARQAETGRNSSRRLLPVTVVELLPEAPVENKIEADVADRVGAGAEANAEKVFGEVVPFGIFDADAEAERWLTPAPYPASEVPADEASDDADPNITGDPSDQTADAVPFGIFDAEAVAEEWARPVRASRVVAPTAPAAGRAVSDPDQLTATTVLPPAPPPHRGASGSSATHEVEDPGIDESNPAREFRRAQRQSTTDAAWSMKHTAHRNLPTTPAVCRNETCGYTTTSDRERGRLLQDNAVIWLEPDPEHPGGLVERRHCQRCRPRPTETIADVDCALCDDSGPLLVGHWATELIDTGTVPALVLRWLTVRKWRTIPGIEGLVCPDHPGL